MATKRDVRKLAEKFGGALVVNSPAPDLDVGLMAPAGYHWSCGEHELVCSQWDVEKASVVWGDLYERAILGIEPCTRETCSCWDGQRDHCLWWQEDEAIA